MRGGKAYMASYRGGHYTTADESTIEVYFKSSEDCEAWRLVDDKPYVYKGGVSEAAFEFDSDGSLWAVTRNEDGDNTGFGAHVCHAPAAAGYWTASPFNMRPPSSNSCSGVCRALERENIREARSRSSYPAFSSSSRESRCIAL